MPDIDDINKSNEFCPLGDPFDHLPDETTAQWTWKDIFIYSICFFTVFLLLGMSTVLYYKFRFPVSNVQTHLLTSPKGKLQHFTMNHAEYDAIVYGDSRALIGVDPSILSSDIGIHVFNYASMAHWFQTQYPQLKRMAPNLSGKTVFWVIGHINFLESDIDDKVNFNGELSIIDFVEYLALGYSITDTFENLASSYFPNFFLFTKNAVVTSKYNNLLDRKIILKQSKKSAINIKTLPDISDKVYSRYPDSLQHSMISGKGNSNALVTILRPNGQEPYIELDSAYLRQRQQEMADKLKKLDSFPEDYRLRRIFSRMLKLFKKNSANLVVIQYIDAPFNYKFKENNEIYEHYMESVANEVLGMGFPYIKMSMTHLTNADYFDSNHLNSQASIKFSHQMASEISKVMKRKD